MMVSGTLNSSQYDERYDNAKRGDVLGTAEVEFTHPGNAITFYQEMGTFTAGEDDEIKGNVCVGMDGRFYFNGEHADGRKWRACVDLNSFCGAFADVITKEDDNVDTD